MFEDCNRKIEMTNASCARRLFGFGYRKEYRLTGKDLNVIVFSIEITKSLSKNTP